MHQNIKYKSVRVMRLAVLNYESSLLLLPGAFIFKKEGLPTPKEIGIGERAVMAANISVLGVVADVLAKNRKGLSYTEVSEH